LIEREREIFLPKLAKLVQLPTLRNGSVALSVTPAGQEKYYRFLMCSQEKYLHFHEKSQGKSGKNTRQDACELSNVQFFPNQGLG